MGKAVIWDLDGVIVDSAPYHYRAWLRFAELVGIKFSRKIFRKIFGMKNDRILQILLNRRLDESEIVKLSDLKEKIFRNMIGSDIKTLPGVVDLIRAFKKIGFKQAIASSAPQKNVQLIVDSLKIGRFFNVIVTEADVEIGKPDPAIFQEAARRLGVDFNDCLVIEDSPAGVKAARKAGMKVITVSDSDERSALSDADLVLRSLKEVDLNVVTSLLSH